MKRPLKTIRIVLARIRKTIVLGLRDFKTVQTIQFLYQITIGFILIVF